LVELSIGKARLGEVRSGLVSCGMAR
jgi:hypothetical protein